MDRYFYFLGRRVGITELKYPTLASSQGPYGISQESLLACSSDQQVFLEFIWLIKASITEPQNIKVQLKCFFEFCFYSNSEGVLYFVFIIYHLFFID